MAKKNPHAKKAPKTISPELLFSRLREVEERILALELHNGPPKPSSDSGPYTVSELMDDLHREVAEARKPRSQVFFATEDGKLFEILSSPYFSPDDDSIIIDIAVIDK